MYSNKKDFFAIESKSALTLTHSSTWDFTPKGVAVPLWASTAQVKV